MSGGTSTSTGATIAGTTDQAIYQTERYSQSPSSRWSGLFRRYV